MNIKNLKRATDIARELPVLEEARRRLSQQGSFVGVHGGDGKESGVLELPSTLNYNILAAINSEINRLKEEVTRL